jgi:adenylosuccinate synthase
LPALRYAKARCGLTDLVVTKGDVLCGLSDHINVCIQYQIHDVVKDVPSHSHEFLLAKPVYVQMPSWQTMADKNFDDFVAFIESSVGVRVTYISHGVNPQDIYRR